MKGLWFVNTAMGSFTITLIALSAIVLVAALTSSFIIAAFFTVILVLMLVGSINDKVTADPPHKGLLTVWGKRQPIVVDEGLKFLPPFFPFIIGVIPINVEKRNSDWTFEKIPTRQSAASNGKKPRLGIRLKMKVAVTWGADCSTGQRAISFLNSGGNSVVTDKKVAATEGMNEVENVVYDQVQEILRRLGAIKTYDEILFGLKDLTLLIIKEVTGEEPDLSFPPPLHPTVATKEEHEQILMEIELRKDAFLAAMARNDPRNPGLPDIKDLGMRIYRINVSEVSFEDEELSKEAQKLEAEKFQRLSEEYETATRIRQAWQLLRAYKKAGTPKPFEACFQEIMYRQLQATGKSNVQTWELRGLPEAVEVLGKVIDQWKGSGSEKTAKTLRELGETMQAMNKALHNFRRNKP